MASIITIHKPKGLITGEISLSGSKSISNRALIIKELCKSDFTLSNLSISKDTKTLQKLLASDEPILDCGHAGTSFRFLTALLAFREGEHILTGSDRMKHRPIGELVNALNTLGANITYLEKEGFPPLRINSPKPTIGSEISISGSISSQYISALLMLAPTLPRGLKIILRDEIVSRPYIKMTLSLLEHFGIKSEWSKNKIAIEPQEYHAHDLEIEGDWSSASYLYGIVATNAESEIKINGLFKNSIQGDRKTVEYFNTLGVITEFCESNVVIRNNPAFTECFFADLNDQPDLAQSISAVCAAKGIICKISGLQTLALKESDRIIALKNELAKVNVCLSENEAKSEFVQMGHAKINDKLPCFETYSDHRMAMSMSLLSSNFMLKIKDSEVVIKSYPDYWNDLESLGYKIVKD